MRRTYTFVCSAGHLVKAENSVLSVDSLCGRCKRNARRRSERATIRRNRAKKIALQRRAFL